MLDGRHMEFPASALVPLGLLLAMGVLGWLLGGAPTATLAPFKGEFAIEEGGALTPEFMAVLLGLCFRCAAPWHPGT